MCSPHFLAYLFTFAAATLLTLVTFSIPFITPLYFLHADASGGVKFGMWGLCLDATSQCSPRKLGYTWDPAIVPWLTQAIVLFPIAAGLCIISALLTIPVLCSHRRDRYYPHPNYSLAVFLSFIVTLFACVFMVALVGVAIRRFNQLGISTHIGPSVWMAVGAVLVLTILAASSGCGNMCRGRYGRASHLVSYNV